jgi:PAS domain S-box-containing protein
MKILIVDDVAANRYLLETIFRSGGYEFVSAADGIEALDTLRADSFDAIISDILMPHMDGFQFLRECKKDPVLKKIPFIFYTATYTAKKDEEFGLALGAIRYIIKPSEPDLLFKLIQEALLEHAGSPRNYSDLPLPDDETFAREYASRIGAKLEKKVQLLKESEEKFRLLYENSMDAILLTRPDGGIQVANPAACAMFGRTEEEIIKSGRDGIVDPTDPHLPDALAERARTGRFKGELTFLRKDGTQFDGEVSTNLFTDCHGQTRSSMIIRDITDRKRAEKLREKLIQDLEQKNAELARFTYIVSHELRTPLITIQGFTGLIEEEVAKRGDSTELTTYLSRVTSAVDTLESLLSDILKLSRAGKCISLPEPVGFGTIAREAVDHLAVSLAKRSVTVEIAPDLPLVNVDHVRTREVLINLIDNAVKFLGDQKNPVIRIGGDLTGKTPVFFVQDNGIGIDPQHLERIFNLFERLDGNVKGTGVGLAIVKRIIEAQGGKIWAESNGEGKGTTFRFTLPGSG